jgi:hypothetical protein
MPGPEGKCIAGVQSMVVVMGGQKIGTPEVD